MFNAVTLDESWNKLQQQILQIFIQLPHWALLFQSCEQSKVCFINSLNISFPFLSFSNCFFFFSFFYFLIFFRCHTSQHFPISPVYLSSVYSQYFAFLAELFSFWTRFSKAYPIKQISRKATDHQTLKVNPSASKKNWASEYLRHNSESTHTNPTSYCLRRSQQEIGTDN